MKQMREGNETQRVEPFSEEQAGVGLSRLKDVPSAEEGYRTFNDDVDQVRMKHLGFHGPGAIKQYPPSDKHYQVMELSPDKHKMFYTQSSVSRSGVQDKLTGKYEDPKFATKGLPIFIKDGDEYHLQHGHHRAAADILSTGKVTARVSEIVGRGRPTRDLPKGKPKFGKPEGLAESYSGDFKAMPEAVCDIPVEVLELLLESSQPTMESKDATGHEHKGKGPGGGQFTTAGTGGGSGKPRIIQARRTVQPLRSRQRSNAPSMASRCRLKVRSPSKRPGELRKRSRFRFSKTSRDSRTRGP